MSRFALVELHKEELKFSAGHFMVFANGERETMHGHDYQVSVAFNTEILDNGMGFDCRLYKEKILGLCKSLDYRFILPSNSAYLRIEEQENQWFCHVGGDTFSFPKKDVVALPITNATLEELSYWFLTQLKKNSHELKAHGIHAITVKVFNGRNESAAAAWQAVTAKQAEVAAVTG